MANKALHHATARERCRAPAILDTLEVIALGRATVSLDHKNRAAYLEEWDGRKARDPDDPARKMLMPGGMTLFWAGYLTMYGTITDDGRALLAETRFRAG